MRATASELLDVITNVRDFLACREHDKAYDAAETCLEENGRGPVARDEYQEWKDSEDLADSAA